MKCNLYEANAGSPLAKSFTDAAELQASDAAKAKLSADELKVFTSLTGFECHKPTVKFGALKSDWSGGGPRQPTHAKGSGVIVAEVANGIRFAVLDAVTPEDLAAAASGVAAPPNSNASDAPAVIVPPVPPDAAPGVTGSDTGLHETKPD